ncbi:MAG TPA: lactate utilization protein [Desulfobacteraceae bacterium]|nr:lactate utilization protein [Desulfobacteraceae bacterium]HPJ68362.1 lactate utilization protein [Desulfobacteraceae bacterium]HPQ28970.1 lactate utilization protein [Desulfobacteraceae bacterium]
MVDTDKFWLWEKHGERCIKNLAAHGFDAHFVQTAEEARELALKIVTGCKTFGFGGSSTVRELGILEELRAKGNIIHDHWQDGLTNEQILDIRLQQGRCDCFFCSANAVSITGEIINVDGVGNRTAAMSFGPKKAIIIAGMNKVTPDLESSLKRVREIAGPMRAKSLGLETPCAKTGICSDCNSPQRICRITTILHRKPSLTDVSIILINRELGF